MLKVDNNELTIPIVFWFTMDFVIFCAKQHRKEMTLGHYNTAILFSELWAPSKKQHILNVERILVCYYENPKLHFAHAIFYISSLFLNLDIFEF